MSPRPCFLCSACLFIIWPVVAPLKQINKIIKLYINSLLNFTSYIFLLTGIGEPMQCKVSMLGSQLVDKESDSPVWHQNGIRSYKNWHQSFLEIQSRNLETGR